jgi:hypothetical protein
VTSMASALDSGGTARRFVWRPLARGEIDHERVWAWMFLLGLGLAVAVPEPWRLSLLCPIKTIVGVPCLTCGSNRALSAMLHLEPLCALAWNPLVVAGAMAWGLYSVYAAVVIIGRLPRLRLVGGQRHWRGPAIGVAVAAVVANWLYLYVAGI